MRVKGPFVNRNKDATLTILGPKWKKWRSKDTNEGLGNPA